MSRQTILDTGPLVAFINPRDNFHEWAVTEWSLSSPPLLTCEAVITEACFLLRNVHRGEEEVMNLLEMDILNIPFCLNDEVVAVRQLLTRYRSVPMSLADACLVRMAELYSECPVLTLDSDFNIYRKHRDRLILSITPLNT
ncbi:MAG: PIN domain-containing protein [Aphanocapsa sp. GSE-SYN-MK-11-07L]|jgi:predicted nucleic acid-binding protein|nr:PIN domain-containing protein [Aphanocapsa sp. GSE-SYN-MK-11-07L]